MKIAVITGASSGMGKWFAAYAKAFFPEIEQIWLIGRNQKRLQRVSDHIHLNSIILPLDLTDEEDIQAYADLLEKEKPDIKLLVNSAGMGLIGHFEDMSSIDSRKIIKINCEALTNITRLSLDYMHENSNIINLASSAAFVPQPGFAVYAASKSYVLSFSQALSKELKKAKIYVTAVCPGTVDTPFIKTAEKYQNIKGYKKFFMSDDKRVVITALWDAKKHRSKSVYGIWMKLLLLVTKLLPVRLLLMFMK